MSARSASSFFGLSETLFLEWHTQIERTDVFCRVQRTPWTEEISEAFAHEWESQYGPLSSRNGGNPDSLPATRQDCFHNETQQEIRAGSWQGSFGLFVMGLVQTS